MIQSGGESNIMASLSIRCEFSGRNRLPKTLHTELGERKKSSDIIRDRRIYIDSL